MLKYILRKIEEIKNRLYLAIYAHKDETIIILKSELNSIRGQIKSYKKLNTSNLKKIDNLIEEKEIIKNKYDLAIKIIQDYTMNEFEKRLEKLYNQKKVVYNKRWVIKDKTAMPMDIRDFARPSKTLEDFSTIKEIWEEVIQYVYDNYAYNGVLDVWQLPEETNVLKAGDCDDSGSYRLAKAKANGLGNNLFACLGFYGDQGHFFTVRIDNEGTTWVLENTSNKYTPVRLEGSKYKICYIFNERYCWVVDGRYRFGDLQKNFSIEVED